MGNPHPRDGALEAGYVYFKHEDGARGTALARALLERLAT